MKKEFTSNVYDGVITKRNTVEFAEGEFRCDVTQLYPGSSLDEEGYLITKKGEKIDLTGVAVKVEVLDVQETVKKDNAAELYKYL